MRVGIDNELIVNHLEVWIDYNNTNFEESTGSQPTPSIYKGISSTGVLRVSKKSKQKKTKSAYSSDSLSASSRQSRSTKSKEFRVSLPGTGIKLHGGQRSKVERRFPNKRHKLKSCKTQRQKILNSIKGDINCQVASNFGNFPVLYENWTQVLEQYKNNVYVNTIQANFVVNDEKHKQYILGSLGKKWKDKRCRLFDKYHNWEQSVKENIQNHPPHIPQDHWAIFIRYRRSAKAMEIANKNAANRAKLVIPHILGSKTLARKMNELVWLIE
ncbi:hypothetical protein Fmac_032523 [Flemingia macrophylla]|uniref:Uncharacterized protein n=1 Tax=Flemingia macrophylla TaxID=520843 RepID=A0ABD1L557_9FABA